MINTYTSSDIYIYKMVLGITADPKVPLQYSCIGCSRPRSGWRRTSSWSPPSGRGPDTDPPPWCYLRDHRMEGNVKWTDALFYRISDLFAEMLALLNRSICVILLKGWTCTWQVTLYVLVGTFWSFKKYPLALRDKTLKWSVLKICTYILQQGG